MKLMKLKILLGYNVLMLSITAPFSVVATTNINQLPDPTIPTVTDSRPVARQNADLKLEAILYSDQRKSAIINGQIITVGSWIDKNQITDIRKDSVIITRNGKKNILTLTAAIDIKKPGTTK